jgi:hypothetical protein
MKSIGFTCKKKIFFIANFHVLGYLYLKNELRAEKIFRLSRGVAVGFWTKKKAEILATSLI